eukprot:TRINITY_DN16840_c0_g1_i1.p1 TRINITY_DN16840_c0_g1~~TRINITY_DN16840_c0_g1_i1.p1  ORF type:complete len:181 (-),score=44.26 TRINITY_DN16840_c0_g1_i1:36-578(-)
MGNVPGVNLSPEEIEQIKTDSKLTEKELKKLHRRFKKIDADGSGTLQLSEFQNIPELAMNPLLERVISVFDKDKNDEVDFQEFISGLATFTQKGNKDDKLRFMFQIYDVDGDGFIANKELFQVLKMMVGQNLNEVQLQQLVDKTMLEADLDKDGRISFDEFVKMIGNTDDLDSKLTISFE